MIGVNCVRLTGVSEADVTEGKARRAKGVCGGTSSRYMTPSKASMTARIESSARSVALMASV